MSDEILLFLCAAVLMLAFGVFIFMRRARRIRERSAIQAESHKFHQAIKNEIAERSDAWVVSPPVEVSTSRLVYPPAGVTRLRSDEDARKARERDDEETLRRRRQNDDMNSGAMAFPPFGISHPGHLQQSSNFVTHVSDDTNRKSPAREPDSDASTMRETSTSYESPSSSTSSSSSSSDSGGSSSSSDSGGGSSSSD